MFDIGFWELALIGIVSLLVIGPEKMPQMVKTVGQWVGHMQRIARDLRREIESEAESEEYKVLNKAFLEEDERLKAMARKPISGKTGSKEGTHSADTETDGQTSVSRPLN